MSSKSMDRWLPCQGYCEMAGSANFFLSLDRCVVLVHGPRWCSSIAAAEMAGIEKKYEKQFYCSEVKQQNLVFGAADELIDALHEIENEQHPSLIALLTSCSMSLIGDDLEGICRSADISCPVLTLDSGGLRGQFMMGYEKGLIRFLEDLPFAPVEKEPGTVNIIGWSTAYPLWEGNLREIRRLLSLIGIQVNVVLGEDGLSLEKAAELKKSLFESGSISGTGRKSGPLAGGKPGDGLCRSSTALWPSGYKKMAGKGSRFAGDDSGFFRNRQGNGKTAGTDRPCRDSDEME